MRTPVITATVPTTRRPVKISFRCNCIFALFQNGAFSASAQELSDHRILRLLESLGLGVFNDFSLIKHSMRVPMRKALSISCVTVTDVTLDFSLRLMINSSMTEPMTG